MTARRQWEELVDAEAVGDVLDADELATLREIEAELASCRIERAMWRELGAAAEGAAEPEDAALVDRALAELDAPTPAPRRHRSRVALASVGMAAAAMIAVLAWPRAEAPAPARISHVVGVVEIDGTIATAGTDLRDGAVVQTFDGTACLALAGAIDVCLAQDSRLALRDVTGAQRVVDLDRGHAVARLQTQPVGESFTIASGDVSVTAVGTVFAVAREHSSEVVASVLEGEVAVASTHGQQALREHERAAVSATGVEVRPSGADEEARTRAILAGERAPAAVAAPTDPSPQTPAESIVVPEPEPAPEPVAVEAPRKTVPTAAALLERARTQMRAGQRSRTAQTYRELVQTHPRSPEAHAIRVALGDLELELGHARAALRSYDRYLADGGGALDREARFGRIRAFARLDDRGGERAAIEAFLARHGGAEARKLRARLQQLDELDALDRAGR